MVVVEQRHQKEEEIRKSKRIYFNIDQDIFCLENIFKELNNRYPKLQKTKDRIMLDQPCILFNFIVYSIDASLPQKAEKWGQLAGGNSIVVYLHKSSIPSDVNSSIYSFGNEVLQACFSTKYTYSDSSYSHQQVLENEHLLKQQILQLIEMFGE